MVTSNEGYIFDPQSRIWRISKDNVIYLSWLDEFLHPNLHDSYLSVLKYYVVTLSGGHANNVSDRFREFARFTYSSQGLITGITSIDIINYRSTLNRENEWYLGALRGFFKTWIKFKISGIEGEIADLLKGWTLHANTKGRAVQTLCPEQGPLSDLEFESLHQALIDAFETDGIDLQDFVLAELLMATGRRPAQVADLKVKDIIEATSEDGLRTFVLNVPRRKQRGNRWRTSFKAFALAPELGVALKAMVEKNRIEFFACVGTSLQDCVDELPIFPRWNVLKNLMDTKISREDILTIMKSEEFHRTTIQISKKLDKIVTLLSVHSERTGEDLHVFPTRLRRTLATRAAREGCGEMIIAELLDHTDTQNVRVYTENVPEHVNAINQAMARQLAPLAQAFAGMIVVRESDAVRGDDLSSRVRSGQGNVGTCGQHGFCGALAPVSCYTCRNFQPWLDAPHQELLDSLLLERERIREITNDLAIASTNDRTIMAVTQVVQICEGRRAQMNKGITHG
ncbi:MAG: site-specific integrase [Gammaproteobacteria bacterium]|nr:site-specific integrase [Gammaproteobacteria bacterium]